MELRKLKDLHFVPIDSPGPALIVHFSKCSPGASVFLTSEIDCDHANDENEGESQFCKATNQFCKTIDLCYIISGKQNSQRYAGGLVTYLYAKAVKDNQEKRNDKKYNDA